MSEIRSEIRITPQDPLDVPVTFQIMVVEEGQTIFRRIMTVEGGGTVALQFTDPGPVSDLDRA